jgi:hypothetical protein
VTVNARDAVLSAPELRAANHARHLVSQIENGVGSKRLQGPSPDEMTTVIDRYRSEVTAKSASFWEARRRRARLRNVAVALGARKLKRWLMRG